MLAQSAWEAPGLLIVQIVIGVLSLAAIWIGARALKQREVTAALERSLAATSTLAATLDKENAHCKEMLAAALVREVESAKLIERLRQTDMSAVIVQMAELVRLQTDLAKTIAENEESREKRWSDMRDDIRAELGLSRDRERKLQDRLDEQSS